MGIKINFAIKLIFGLTLAAAIAYAAGDAGSGLLGDFLRFRTSSLPTTCEDGDIRFDGSDLKLCGSNSFSTLGGNPEVINYFSDFDAATVSNVVEYDDASAATDLTGGSPSVTSSSETSAPLNGSSSYKLSKGAADYQHEGWAITTSTIERPESAGQAPVVVQFVYETSANYVSGDVEMYYYDVGNSQLNELGGRSSLSGNIDNALPACPDVCTYTAEMSGDSNSTTLRIGFHVATTNASSYDIVVDRINVTYKYGSLTDYSTDWDTTNTITFDATTTAPTKGTTTRDVFAYRRNGAVMDARIEYIQTVAGADGSGTYLLSMVDGLKIDTTKTGTGVNAVIGQGWISTNATFYNVTKPAILYVYDEDNLGLMFNVLASGTLDDSMIVSTDSTTSTALGSTNVQYHFEINDLPIQGWDAGNVIDAVVADYQNARVFATDNDGDSITASTTDIKFKTESFDTHNAWDGDQFTAPYDMTVLVTGSIYSTSSSPQIYFYVDGVQKHEIGIDTSHTVFPFAGVIDLNKGEVLSIRMSASTTLQSSTTRHSIYIYGLPNLRTFAAVGDWVSRDFSSAKNYRTEWVNLNCDSASAITEEQGSWVTSIGNISVGVCVVTLDSNIFSSAPQCTTGSQTNSTMTDVSVSSATSVSIGCTSDTGTACGAFDAYLECRGPR